MRVPVKASGLLLLLFSVILILSNCMDGTEKKKDPRGPWFAGAASCAGCHAAVYDAYQSNNHFHSTAPAGPETVTGSFEKGKNSFLFSSGDRIDMEKRDSGLFQVAYHRDGTVEPHRMDIAFGTKHAQTFLYWKGDKTYELPVSYYRSVGGWGTSPGFSSATINFNRFIGANCFECHTSFIGSKLEASTNGIREVMDRSTLIYGIDCERCHGAAAAHVNFHKANPEIKEAHHMTSIRNLPRERKLDVCAVCHSGNNKVQERSTFRFRPGDTLANFFSIWPAGDAGKEVDVHGNQHQLLSESKCFQSAITMDCSTCHDPHRNASANITSYATACKNCHQQTSHPVVEGTATSMLQNNCVDCHMPLQASRAISFQAAGSQQTSPYLLRTHNIGVYRDGKKIHK